MLGKLFLYVLLLLGTLMSLPISICAQSSSNQFPKWVSVGDNSGSEPVIGSVTAMRVDQFENLYVGGAFGRLGGVLVTNVAKWDGRNWSALGPGLGMTRVGYGDLVYAIAVEGNYVYAGGTFTNAGSYAVSHVAKWDGASWAAMGSGINGDIRALAASGANVYAGGIFTLAGGLAATNVAKWDGTAWSPLGSGLNGLNGVVFALVEFGGELYAGGDFTSSGTNSVKYIAKWNGASWQSVGTGVNGSVIALATLGTNLYAGGYFTTAGGSSIKRLAKWDGASWASLQTTLAFPNIPVESLAVSGSTLYIGYDPGPPGAGSFVLCWNGSTWKNAGVSTSAYIWALACVGTDLYLGGYFRYVRVIGTQTEVDAMGLARGLGLPRFTSLTPSVSPGQQLCSFESSSGATLQLLSSTNLTDWWTNTSINAVSSSNSVPVDATKPREYFRLRRVD